MRQKSTYPEVVSSKVILSDFVARLQLTQIKSQNVLNLLIVDLSQNTPLFLQRKM